MRNLILILLVTGCEGSAALMPPADAGGEDDLARKAHPDLAQLPDDLSAPEDAHIPDLGPPPDLATCDGSCVSSGCDTGQVPAGGTCRAIQTQDQCDAAHRQFIPVLTVGYCGDCAGGYQDYFGFCAKPSCSGDGSLGVLCAQLQRGCDGSGAAPHCTDCTGAAMLDTATQACVPNTCQRRSDCPEIAGFFCTQHGVSDAPQCYKRSCAPGQTWDRTPRGTNPTSQACAPCVACGGNEWPVSDAQGQCYCTASPGWFYDHSNSVLALQQCDEDQDGWLKASVKSELAHATYNASMLDYTVLLNIQCTIPYFTGVQLINEWGQKLPLALTDIGQQAGVSGVAMYEDPANDTAGYISAQVDGSSTVLGSSVNSLTKACSSSDLDLNHNGVADVIEDQTTTPRPKTLAVWADDYQPLTHFIELYHAHFSPSPSPSPSVQLCDTCPVLPLPGVAGTLIIEERSRCSDLPLQPNQSSSNYWQDCVRRRSDDYQAPGTYEPSQPLLGFDFAAYDCLGDSSGACSYSWPASFRSPGLHAAPPPPAPALTVDGSLPAHGLCNGGVPHTWMGMTAYSQFMCGNIQDGATQYPNDIPTGNVLDRNHPDAPWEALDCFVGSQPPTVNGPGTTATFRCQDTASSAARVTWVARRYSDYVAGNYTGGCIDEGLEYSVLCSGSSSGDASGPYGQIMCDPPCRPDTEIMRDGPRTYALCMYPVLSAFAGRDLSTGTYPVAASGQAPPAPSPQPIWQLTGQVPVGSVGGLAKPVDGGVAKGVADGGVWTLQ